MSLLTRPSLSVIELKAAIEYFDSRLSKLDEVQSEIEVELENDLLDDDLDKAAEFRTKSFIPRIKAAEKLLELDKKDDDDVSTNESSAT